MTKGQLEKLSTQRLKAYLHSWLQYPEKGLNDDDTVRFAKDNTLWIRHYKLIKEVMATREHIERTCI